MRQTAAEAIESMALIVVRYYGIRPTMTRAQKESLIDTACADCSKLVQGTLGEELQAKVQVLRRMIGP